MKLLKTRPCSGAWLGVPKISRSNCGIERGRPNNSAKLSLEGVLKCEGYVSSLPVEACITHNSH